MYSFYEKLGVKRDASQKEIYEAYLRCFAETHPDNGGKKVDHFWVKQIYSILKDPDSRLRYDSWLMRKEHEEREGERMSNYKPKPSQTKKWNLDISLPCLVACIGIIIFVLIAFISSYKSAHDSRTINAYVGRDTIFAGLTDADTIAPTTYDSANENVKNDDRNETRGRGNDRGELKLYEEAYFESEGVYRMVLPSDIMEAEKKTKGNKTETYKVTNYKTGDRPYKGYFGAGTFDKESLSELMVINKSIYDAVVILINANGRVLRHAFIKAGDTFIMNEIPTSICVVRAMMGHEWNSQKDNGSGFPKGGFMKDVSFTETSQEDRFNFIPTENIRGIEYPNYSMTLHKVRDGNLKSNSISEEKFFSK